MKEPAQRNIDVIEELQAKIRILENENQLLRERLDESGISYADIAFSDSDSATDIYDPNQGARIKSFEVTDKIARDFFMMFCRGRKDVYELRYTNPRTGKNGYYTQCFNRWDRNCHIQKRDDVRCKDCELRAYKPITLPLIKAHMNGSDPNGNDVVAIYPMLENNLCQLLVFDFDNHTKGAEQEDYANVDDSWKEEINALRRICRSLHVDAVVERSRSGRGAHLWIFFKEMIPARLARRFGFALLEKGAESVNLKSFRYYDRMIPAQDALPEGGLGNVIALPLQGMALKAGNSAFVDENWNAYEDQLKTLAGTKRLTRQEIKDYLSLWYGTGKNSEDEGDDAPWDKDPEIDKDGVRGIVHIVLADRIYIDSSGMSNKVKRQLRRMATFSNKQYFQNQAMDLPNYDESRFIYLGNDEGKYIVLPRGLREEILKRFDKAGIQYEIEDKRSDGRKIKVSFKGNLKESQIPAVEAMLENETGILHAATAFGKTVVCCDMITRRGVSTLILVDRADLMNQWLKRLEEFLNIDEELPEYQTKTGRTKRRKSLIGNLQGTHDTLTGIVDVAMIRSLKKKDGFHPMLKEYAQVYFDECHHAASDSAIEVLQEINAKLGEGFDFPRLDTLFMATPVSGENVVEQYVGRLNRDYDGKENVIVYDYVDSHIPKFDKMYAARLKAYKKIGYELCVSIDGEKQKANAIYDIDNYAGIYWRDLEDAKTGVVISSPRLNTQKVNQIIGRLNKSQKLGVKVTIVTWHPDVYQYGRDDVRMELMERLRKAGFEIRLMEESCEHYAVIDHEIVWYGSINLLSKEDAEDNLMRVCSKDIAAELLEMTFGSETNLQEW